MNSSLKIALATLALAASSMASAQWYGAVGVGQSVTSFDKSVVSLNNANVAETSVREGNGYKLTLGYDLNPNVALEVGYANLGQAAYRYMGTGALAGKSGESIFKQDTATIALRGTLPLSGDWSLTGKVGASFNRATVDNQNDIVGPFSGSVNTKEAVLGVGVKYAMDKVTSVLVEYEDFGNFGAGALSNRGTGALASVSLMVKF